MIGSSIGQYLNITSSLLHKQIKETGVDMPAHDEGATTGVDVCTEKSALTIILMNALYVLRRAGIIALPVVVTAILASYLTKNRILSSFVMSSPLSDSSKANEASHLFSNVKKVKNIGSTGDVGMSCNILPKLNTVGEMIEETGFYQSIRLTNEAPLVQKQSRYQMIEVRNSLYYGKVLILDGVMQLTERDADSYNEMMAHIPMFQHQNPKRVLIIGGGDGYVLSEVLKHTSVVHVDHVDLDGDVISVCKQYFSWGAGWDDPRVTLHIDDGAKFVLDAPDNTYDVIIQDSSDPWTWTESGERVTLPSSVLYSPQHFTNIHRILTKQGVLALQAESLQIPSDLDGIRAWRKLALSSGFESSRYGSIVISSYPTGQIGLLLCEKDVGTASTLDEIVHRYDRDMGRITSNTRTSYYHPPLQSAAFVLPKWAINHIYED